MQATKKPRPEPQPFSDKPRPQITLHPVESSQVSRIGYDDESQTLAVQFKHGARAIYCYPNVRREVYEAFKSAESIGAYFGANIKGMAFDKFPSEDETPAS